MSKYQHMNRKELTALVQDRISILCQEQQLQALISLLDALDTDPLIAASLAAKGGTNAI